MTAFYWTNELVFELIKRFQDKPELWDYSSDLYRNKDKKQESWNEIAKALDTNVSTVERKMRMLMSQYRRELQTRRSSKWFAFEKLSFLKARQVNVSFKNRQRPTCFVSVNQDREGQVSQSRLQGDGIRTDRPAFKHRVNILRPRERKSQERDEYATYGELVAMKLKKITSPYARSTAQYHINNILYKAEIGAYDKNPRERDSNSRFILKDHFRAGSSSAHNDSNYDGNSQRSSSPAKSMEYDMKFEEIEELDE